MWTSALLCVGLAHGLLIRSPRETPESKIKHILQDIEESVSKAGVDAEMVIASLTSYDGQLHTSLKREIGTLNNTLTSLLAMHAKYNADITKSQAKVSGLEVRSHDSKKMASKYESSFTDTRGKFDRLQENVQMLIALLKNAHVTPQGKLLTPETPDANGEPTRVYTAIRRLLAASPALRKPHPDVFAQFLPPSSPGASPTPPIHMTPYLLQQTITALSGIGDRFHSMESHALLQTSSVHQRLEGEAVAAGVRGLALHGVEADNERTSAELAASIKFTRAVMKIDLNFAEIVGRHLKSNGDLVHPIRDLRQAQLQILRDLIPIMGGPSATGGLSFLQVKAESSSSLFSDSGLQSEAEAAIRNHGDTHAILMRVKERLDSVIEPINANNVRETMVEIQGVLHSVEDQHSKNEEAVRRCNSQKFHAKEEAEGVKANLALMSMAHDHADAAIKAAQNNLKGIEKKAGSLDKASHDLERISSEAMKSLEQQSRDRETILMAVEKATQVIDPDDPALMDSYSKSDASAISVHQRNQTARLMRAMSEDIKAQEMKERTFRKQQVVFQSQFTAYVQEYMRLLSDRQRHYDATLAVLQLHVSELASDFLAQKQALSTGDELSQQSAGLCESVLRFYEKHAKMRSDLSATFRSTLANMPTMLSDGSIASA